MASSSERPDRNGAHGQNGSLPPPSSPTDSVAQAMKNDLEELIGYIDNLAFDQKNKNPAPKTAGTPSTNKQLFPSHDNHTSDRNIILQDRTNKVALNTQQNVTPAKLREPELAKVMSPMRYRDTSLNLSYERKERETKMLDPVGNRATREEPAGSPPPQEASLYFHDESFSLNLSESQDAADESHISYHISSDKRVTEEVSKNDLGRPPRLLSTLQKNGLVSSPERSKAISFVSISKDPTPSKPFRSSSSSHHEQIRFSTPTAHGKSTAFSANGDDSDFRRQRLESRQATPFPRNQNRDIDRLEQENLDRKGNEWWRARPESQDNGTERDASVRFDSKDTASINENTKMLKWEHVESFASPIPRPQYSKGTPHPSKKVSDTVLATPTPHQGTNSNLVLTSPESAKKLLRSAMEALQDARKERDEARQWADDIKKSVNHWVEDQRRLIRTESASLTENSNPTSAAVFERKHQDVEISINDLRNEMKSFKFDTQAHINSRTKGQDEKIRDLSHQLLIVKNQLALLSKEDTSNHRDADHIPARIPNKSEKTQPGLAHKTPVNETIQLVRSASRSDASHGSQRTRRATPSGGHLIDYGNGVTKELHPDGTTVTRFKNGDVETRFDPNTSTTKNPSATCKVAYYHSKEQVLQITQRDGSVLYEYANGQVERHCADGVKIVLFPDGTKAVV
eukprot:CAMPEP_0116157358 /NCGR_PEP_ID=MMETSP0329-20121206/23303_1 /TAXON_ID=697910 /ORGANISM="Pseudo-nitzschia arenysensis, Strain B593" /LENGTH=684 /DNA_ID=CAMNT_0003654463 /DNA_START=134 /DNA_END=2188 /DNA_ORIENTATION=-